MTTAAAVAHLSLKSQQLLLEPGRKRCFQTKRENRTVAQGQVVPCEWRVLAGSSWLEGEKAGLASAGEQGCAQIKVRVWWWWWGDSGS